MNEIFTDSEISDVKEIAKHANTQSLYSFCLPLGILESFNSKMPGTSIEVSHHSDYLHFSGVTSSANWNSNSLVNNILYTGSLEASGIFIPLKVTKGKYSVNMNVQYLIICQPIIFGEHNV